MASSMWRATSSTRGGGAMGYVHGRHEKSVWRGRRGDTMSGEMRETGWRMGRERRRRRGRRKHENTVVVGVRAMSSGQHEEEDGGEEEEASTSSFVLPIFPLSLVALPDGMVRRKIWTRSVSFLLFYGLKGRRKAGNTSLTHSPIALSVTYRYPHYPYQNMG